MTADLIQFVDRIGEAPTVLLDVNDEAKWACEIFTPAPSLLRRASAATMISDGEFDAATVRADRIVTLSLDLICASQDEKAVELQKLARLIDRDRGWLKYQPVGAEAPVFFLVKRGDVPLLLSQNVNAAVSRLELSLPAAPYAYGLRIDSTASVRNNPAGTTDFPAPMAFTMTDVKGDAPAPLRISRAGAANTPRAWALASRAGVPITEPLVRLARDFQIVSPATTTWSAATSSEPDAVTGGTVQDYTRSSGSIPLRVRTNSAATAGMPRGEYRILARIKVGRLRVQDAQGAGEAYAGPSGSGTEQFIRRLSWYDLGVRRLPASSSRVDPLWEDPSTTADIGVTLEADPTFAAVSLDAVAFVPVGLDGDVSSSYFRADLYTGFAVDDLRGQVDVLASPEGGLPWVVPGQVNEIRFIGGFSPRSILADAVSSPTWTSTLGLSYYPRYLLDVRPVAS